MDALSDEPTPFIECLRHGDLTIEMYLPENIDEQQPHDRDEIYIIKKGTGRLNRNGEHLQFGVGDVFFVPATMPHHFEDFSDDFETWVIFYGPHGGHEQGPEHMVGE